jgi:RNA polymerase sigma-32 factor
MMSLSERERDILTQRRLYEEPPTLETLGAQYGVSRERIRQIEAHAFEKLRKAVIRVAKQSNQKSALAA